MKKYVLFLAILISILLLFNSAIAQITPYMRYWMPQVQFPLFPSAASRFSLGYPTLYPPPLMPPLPFPFGRPFLQPSPPFLMAPQIRTPSPVLRMAAATITIFSAPTLSTIQVSALPIATVALTPIPSTTGYSFILPALLTIATAAYIQTQTASVTSVIPFVPLVGTPTAVLPTIGTPTVILPGLVGVVPTI